MTATPSLWEGKNLSVVCIPFTAFTPDGLTVVLDEVATQAEFCVRACSSRYVFVLTAVRCVGCTGVALISRSGAGSTGQRHRPAARHHRGVA